MKAIDRDVAPDDLRVRGREAWVVNGDYIVNARSTGCEVHFRMMAERACALLELPYARACRQIGPSWLLARAWRKASAVHPDSPVALGGQA